MVSVTVKSGETRLRVEKRLGVATMPRLLARSSEARAPNLALDSERWEEGVAWSVRDRLKSGAGDKGRALAIWQESGEAASALAVLSWHREESGPFYLMDLSARADLARETQRELEAELLLIMLEAAEKPGAAMATEWQQTLRWMTVQFDRAPLADGKRYSRAAIERAKRLGFERYKPPPAAPAKLSKRWLGERVFE